MSDFKNRRKQIVDHINNNDQTWVIFKHNVTYNHRTFVLRKCHLTKAGKFISRIENMIHNKTSENWIMEIK